MGSTVATRYPPWKVQPSGREAGTVHKHRSDVVKERGVSYQDICDGKSIRRHGSACSRLGCPPFLDDRSAAGGSKNLSQTSRQTSTDDTANRTRVDVRHSGTLSTHRAEFHLKRALRLSIRCFGLLGLRRRWGDGSTSSQSIGRSCSGSLNDAFRDARSGGAHSKSIRFPTGLHWKREREKVLYHCFRYCSRTIWKWSEGVGFVMRAYKGSTLASPR